MPRVFVPNPNFAEEFEASQDSQEGKRAAAEEIKRHAEPMARAVGAPWMPRSGHETIEVVEEEGEVYVVNTDHAAHLQEYGSVNNPPHAPLRRGARAAGLDVAEEQDL